MTITDERKKTIDFTETYFPPDPSSFLSVAGKSFDYDNLKGLKIGAQTGTIQANWLEQNLKADNTILNYDTADQAVADLNAGNIDLDARGRLLCRRAGHRLERRAEGRRARNPDRRRRRHRRAQVRHRTQGQVQRRARRDEGRRLRSTRLITKYFPDMGDGPFFKK